MKTRSKIICGVLGIVSVVVAAGFAYWFLSVHLPSDQKARRYFQAHQAQFAALAASLTKQPTASFLDTSGSEQGTGFLKGVGGQFLRQSDGTITIYVWGSGCAICHDSYEGYVHIPPEAPAFRFVSVVPALDHGLPQDGRGGVEDGFYVLPLSDGWYVFREENG